MTSHEQQPGRQIGRMPRREDRRFLMGQGRYLDDIVFPGALHVHFVRSPHAHARIIGIDMNRARSMPGIIAVATGQELNAFAALPRGRELWTGVEPDDQGQQHGAVAMGIGGVLREQVVYDASGQNLTGSFMDYAMTTAADLPTFKARGVRTPTNRNPTGGKGMSKGGVIGAVASAAVNDALAPFGVMVKRQPLTPPAIFALLPRPWPMPTWAMRR